jgi:hypothetical protein
VHHRSAALLPLAAAPAAHEAQDKPTSQSSKVSRVVSHVRGVRCSAVVTQQCSRQSEEMQPGQLLEHSSSTSFSTHTAADTPNCAARQYNHHLTSIVAQCCCRHPNITCISEFSPLARCHHQPPRPPPNLQTELPSPKGINSALNFGIQTALPWHLHSQQAAVLQARCPCPRPLAHG